LVLGDVTHRVGLASLFSHAFMSCPAKVLFFVVSCYENNVVLVGAKLNKLFNNASTVRALVN
jgi:hypothetical protein